MQTRILTAALGAVALVSSLPAQGTYIQFGSGNPSCISSNADAHFKPGVSLRTQVLTNEYAYGYKAPSALTVLGFAIYTQTTTSGTVKMDTGFYRASGGPTGTSPSNTSATTGECTVGADANWYISMFKAPQKVVKDENFWVSQYNSQTVRASSLLNGQATTLGIYWRRPPGGTGNYSRTGIVSNPGIVIICENETPVLGADGVPTAGNAQFALEVTNGGQTGNLCNIVLGISKTKSGPINLPFDLGVIGFSGSTLWVSNEFMFPGVIQTNGTRKLPLPVPTNVTKGLKFYNQAYVVDRRTNTVRFTNAGEGTTG